MKLCALLAAVKPAWYIMALVVIATAITIVIIIPIFICVGLELLERLATASAHPPTSSLSC
jgi:hypothetical protein